MRMKNEEAWESQSSNDESLVTKNVFINGKMEERVIALPKNYLMEQPKDKGKLLGSLDKEKLLGVTYNFTNPQPLEKPRDFDPFGHAGFAHLWLQYD